MNGVGGGATELVALTQDQSQMIHSYLHFQLQGTQTPFSDLHRHYANS